jgi:hypothetical protein
MKARRRQDDAASNRMKATRQIFLVSALVVAGVGRLMADQEAKVTEAVNQVKHGLQSSNISTPAHEGTLLHDGEFIKTESISRAEMQLPSTSVTRIGANTIFNYTVDSNLIDLREGTILFCKPKSAGRELQIKTAAVTAGITGTTGFMSVQGGGKKKTYIFGIIEGHATANADGKLFLVGAGEIIEFRTGANPFKFSFDLPRFVKSSSLLHKYKSKLTNQSEIDRAVAEYQDDLSRGFIIPPKSGIDYSSDVPIFASPAYD